MREIRLCRSCNGRQDPWPEPPGGGVWHPDTPGNREALNTIAEAGNRNYGAGTHWIVERTVSRRPVPADPRQDTGASQSGPTAAN